MDNIVDNHSIDEKNIDYYCLRKEKEEKLLRSCIFVFDTSALLDFYNYTSVTQSEILNNILGNTKFKDRLWIPGHVEYEYLLQRENVIDKTFKENYENKLNSTMLKPIDKSVKNLKKQIKNLISNTEKNNNHPYLEKDIIKNLKDLCGKVYGIEYSETINKINEQISKKKKEIIDKKSKDNVLTSFKKLFKVGKEYDYNKIIEIIKEGEFRYKNNIPPGFGDSGKDGIQKYGDLINWKQIIEYARENNEPIIFILNDITKNDWCDIEERHSEKRIIRPKYDLLKEMGDNGKIDFWMYTLSQFIYKAQKILNIQLTESAIEEVRNVEEMRVNKLNESEVCSKFSHNIFERGDIFYADLSPAIGSEKGGIRPVIVVQNNVGNKYSPTVMVAAVTAQIDKAKLPTHVEISSKQYGLSKDSVILLEQLKTIDKRKFKEKIGHLTEEDMLKVNNALSIELQMM